jgi:hypothetical protein
MKCFICHVQLPNVFDTCWIHATSLHTDFQARNVVQFSDDSIVEPILEESIVEESTLEESILEGSTESAKSSSSSTKFHIIETVHRRFAANEFKKNYDTVSTQVIESGGLNTILFFLKDGLQGLDPLQLQREVAFLSTRGNSCKRGKSKESSALTCHGFRWAYGRIGL